MSSTQPPTNTLEPPEGLTWEIVQMAIEKLKQLRPQNTVVILPSPEGRGQEEPYELKPPSPSPEAKENEGDLR